MISETLAKRYWPGRNPVGETIRYGDGTREIAGVVSDARDVSLDRPPMPTLYHVWDEKDAPIATIGDQIRWTSGDADAGDPPRGAHRRR